jgi:hypothetical protein
LPNHFPLVFTITFPACRLFPCLPIISLPDNYFLSFQTFLSLSQAFPVHSKQFPSISKASVMLFPASFPCVGGTLGQSLSQTRLPSGYA